MDKTKIKGFIFDMDDTLVESEKLNIRLITDYFLDTWKIELDDNDKNLVYGHSWQTIYSEITKKYSLDISIFDVQDAILERKRKFLQKNKLPVAKGIDKVLALPQKKVIVSGSGTKEIQWILENVGILDKFEAFFSIEDYGKGKPEPDGFLMGLSYLELNPDEVIVFEDAKSGILSAKRAGIFSVFIREFAESDCANLADLAFDTFSDFFDFFSS
jgi:sugar-phosphatase